MNMISKPYLTSTRPGTVKLQTPFFHQTYFHQAQVIRKHPNQGDEANLTIVITVVHVNQMILRIEKTLNQIQVLVFII